MLWKNQRLLSIVMVLVAWLTLPLLGKRSIKRFLPAAILIVLIESISAYFGKKRKWWVFYKHPNSFIWGELPFNIGPFFVGSMWILKFTYGNFKRFILMNAIIDGIFAFLITRLLRKMKVVTLVRLNEFQFFLRHFYKAFLLYGFQYLLEKNHQIVSIPVREIRDKGNFVREDVIHTTEDFFDKKVY